MAYAVQKDQQSELNQELSEAQLKLANYSSDLFASQRKQIENRLAEIEKKIQSTQNSLSQLAESSQITDTLFTVAKAYSVEITEISQSEVNNRKVDGFSFSSTQLKVTVEGDVGNLTAFISKLSSSFPTDMFESIKLDIPRDYIAGAEVSGEQAETEGSEEPEGEGEVQGEGEEEGEGEITVKKPSAKIQLAIYNYEGN